MSEPTLRALLDGNRRHVDSLPEGYFAAVEDGQRPAAVSVCCADSRVPQEGMWSVEEPGWLFAPSTIGNQTWTVEDGERVVDGSVLYPLRYADTRVVAVVGHTGCGAVTAALEAVRRGGPAPDTPAGVVRLVDSLVPVVEAGLADDRVDPEREPSLVNQLAEFNVDRQVAFLREAEDVPDDVTVYGFVYDFQGVYGDARGRASLVNADGETDPDRLRARVDPEFADHVGRLL